MRYLYDNGEDMIKGTITTRKEDRKEIKTLCDKLRYITGLIVSTGFPTFFLYGVYKLEWTVSL